MAKKSTPRRTNPPRRRSARGSASTSKGSSSTPGETPSTPEKSEGIDSEGKLEEAALRRFVFQTFGRARRTQDSPVMPDVWLRYIRVAEKVAKARIDFKRDKSSRMPGDLVDLLLTPWSGVRPGWIANELRRQLEKSTTEHLRADLFRSARIALTDSRVVVCANFETLVRHVVPLSNWWRSLFLRRRQGKEDERLTFGEVFEKIEDELKKTKKPSGPNIELSRYAALVGFISLLHTVETGDEFRELARLAYQLGPPPNADEIGSEEPPRSLTKEQEDLLWRVYQRAKDILRLTKDRHGADQKGIYLINLNRSAAQTLYESRATVKADAAHRLFNINTTGIAFAVIDGGIDATHPAFLRRLDEGVRKVLKKGDPSGADCLKFSRILQTYDFTLVRDIVARAVDQVEIKGRNRILIDRIFADRDEKTVQALEHLRIRCNSARDLDWEILSPLIRIPHNPEINRNKGASANAGAQNANAYRVPGTDHGTHVAGILAADLPYDPGSGRQLEGMCPHLSLYDLRVFDDQGRGDEFSILCAIEFVGWLNRDRSNPVVHGVNLSLALAHDVDSFACGQTPICEACNHLCGAGTLVVVAAGNTGFEGGPEKQSLGTGYRPISITDPGNAEYVITVGSTHRRDPHLYGVSYFSARGPTGDGRRKPDILAPGEKITSTIRGGGSQRMDGTSMAAPHVAGAAALLMARHPELIGRPLQIKQILMRAATDLNREPSFQGAGLLDVLRALQSV
jgi:serine protease AprX